MYVYIYKYMCSMCIYVDTYARRSICKHTYCLHIHNTNNANRLPHEEPEAQSTAASPFAAVAPACAVMLTRNRGDARLIYIYTYIHVPETPSDTNLGSDPIF